MSAVDMGQDMGAVITGVTTEGQEGVTGVMGVTK